MTVYEVIFRLTLACILGGLSGLERKLKPTGRTQNLHPSL